MYCVLLEELTQWYGLAIQLREFMLAQGRLVTPTHYQPRALPSTPDPALLAPYLSIKKARHSSLAPRQSSP
jgi:hypothetical protein